MDPNHTEWFEQKYKIIDGKKLQITKKLQRYK